MIDLDQLAELARSAARAVGAEIASPWFYLQLGLILAGAGIAFGIGAAVHSRVDITSLAMGWPETVTRTALFGGEPPRLPPRPPPGNSIRC